MKDNKRRFALATAILCAALATGAGAQAQDKKASTVSKQDVQAKFDYCQTCHGISGQGFRGAFPIPRLAGQQPEYIENQLKAFIEHRRINPVMFNVAHVLSPGMLEALTTKFKELDPKPLGGAPRNIVPDGKMIYEKGLGPDVPACASCHGATAKGDGQFPRLAGQLNDYVIKKLTNWDTERGQDKANVDTSIIMQPIAHNLTAAQITAVAAYLSSLE